MVPRLLRGYQALGAQIAGRPAWDPEFNSAGVLVLLPTSRLPSRYARQLYGHPRNG